MTLKIPRGLAASCHKTPLRAAWLERLPDVLRNLEHRWSLTLDAPFDGDEVSCSYVTPVVRADGTPAVLKIGMPHMEGEHEIHGLRFWNGDPTVRLLMADDGLGAMLLERCEPGTALRALPECEQDVVISGLLRRLWRPPSTQHPFRPLSALTKYWSDETLAQIEQWPDPGLVREGLRLFTELPRTEPMELVLATDLHAGNVLHAEREPWLVIDATPVQLLCEIAIGPGRNDQEIYGPARRRSRARPAVDVRSRSGGAAGRLEQRRFRGTRPSNFSVSYQSSLVGRT